MISDLNRSLGSRQFLNVADERTCFLHRARAHLKVPDCALLKVTYVSVAKTFCQSRVHFEVI